MKGLIKSTILVVSLSTLSFTSSGAIDTNSAKGGPRCEPYPECQGKTYEQPQNELSTFSEIYQFDKMLMRS